MYNRFADFRTLIKFNLNYRTNFQLKQLLNQSKSTVRRGKSLKLHFLQAEEIPVQMKRIN
jgi:hypothetical protein